MSVTNQPEKTLDTLHSHDNPKIVKKENKNMNPIYEDRIIPPTQQCFTPTNTHRRIKRLSDHCSSATNESRGYGTMRSRDLQEFRNIKAPLEHMEDIKPYNYFNPGITSTRNNSMNPIGFQVGFSQSKLCTPRSSCGDFLRKTSDSSGDIPIAPPCSVDDYNESDDDVFLEDFEPLPPVPPSLNLHIQYFNCQLCDAYFYSHETLESHLQCHRLDQQNVRQSPILRQRVSKPKSQKFKCEECGKKFKEKVKLNMHTVRHHKPEMEIMMVL